MKRILLPLSATLLAVSPLHAVTLHGITTANQLVSFDSANPSTFTSTVSVSGLVQADGTTPDPLAYIANLSYNPQSGSFFGVDSNANIYSLSITGAATLLNNTFAPGGFAAGMAYDTFTAGFLYADDSAESYNISTAGVVSQNANLFYGIGDANEGSTPFISGVGIDSDFGLLYYLDSALGTLATGVDPVSGEIFTIGSLNTSFTDFGGITVDFDGNIWGALSSDGLNSELFSIDSTTGAATSQGALSAGLYTVAIPEPSSALLALASSLLLLRRRRA